MFSPSERVLLDRVSAVLELLPAALDARLTAVTGLNAFANGVLAALVSAERHTLRMTVLASQTNATLPRLSRVVSRLEERGLVVRQQCPADARATNAVLTTAGAEHVATSQDAIDAVLRDLVVDCVEPSLAEPLAQALGQLLRRIDRDGRFAVTACRSIAATEPAAATAR
ncbi:MAG: MarR family transcriptional regulator [Propionicimonas sp.]